jgi:hypothetical protein
MIQSEYVILTAFPLQPWLRGCPLTLRYIGCGRKNIPIWEGHSCGWGAHTEVGSTSSNSGVRAVFSVHHGVVEEFIKNGGSPVATQRAFWIRFAPGRRDTVPDKKTIYRWVSAFYRWFNPLPALTLQSARDLNAPCRPKCSKALLL